MAKGKMKVRRRRRRCRSGRRCSGRRHGHRHEALIPWPIRRRRRYQRGPRAIHPKGTFAFVGRTNLNWNFTIVGKVDHMLRWLAGMAR
jgi:hypothetical protein